VQLGTVMCFVHSQKLENPRSGFHGSGLQRKTSDNGKFSEYGASRNHTRQK